MLNRTALLSLLVLVVGCAGQTRTFDVRVQNNSSKPLTLVLAKDAGPKEPLWATPEDVAVTGSGDWGIGVVPACKAEEARSVSGTFPAGSNAYLRIYVGDLTLGEALKVVPGTSQRLDITLQPGSDDFVVVDTADGGIQIQPSTEPTEPTTEAATAPTTDATTAPTAVPATAPAADSTAPPAK